MVRATRRDPWRLPGFGRDLVRAWAGPAQPNFSGVLRPALFRTLAAHARADAQDAPRRGAVAVRVGAARLSPGKLADDGIFRAGADRDDGSAVSRIVPVGESRDAANARAPREGFFSRRLSF